MENKNIAGQLRHAAETVEGWGNGTVPEIEKDSVLATLRTVYQAVKCGDAAVPVPAEDRDGEQTALTADGIYAPVDVPEEATSPEPAPEEQPGEAPQSYVMESMPRAETYPLEVTEVAAPADVAGEEGSMIVNSADEKQEFERNRLFDESEIPAKPKLDRRAILSLYGDDPAPAAPAAEAKSPACGPETPVPPATPATPPAPAYVPPATEPQPAAMDAEPVQVLGDVLGGGSRTVGDFYAGQTDTTDVASVVGSGRVASLRQAMGINDKFLLVRNLFDGNAEVCDRVLTTLDGFTDLDDALIYIHENFNWNPDNEAVRLLVDALTRKLS